MMTLTVTGRHVVVSPATRQQIEKKMSRLRRLLNDNALSAQCVVAQERARMVCELTVRARGDHTLVGIGRHTSLVSAVGLAVEKVSQQALRLKDRWKTRRRDVRPAPGDADVPRSEPRPRVVRSRGYAVKPMTVDDAILALETGPQAVVVFRRTSTAAVAVLFRRPDGHFGLIETEA
jgi:ribosome hibernation promoting factor